MKGVVVMLPACLALLSAGVPANPAEGSLRAGTRIGLPQPRREGRISVEQALDSRRSIRHFQSVPLRLDQVSQLLWAAQGRSGNRFRTAPSAGALYPLEVYLVAGNVEGLASGVYRYDPAEHDLEAVIGGDVRNALVNAAYGQDSVESGVIALVFTAVYERTAQKYGKRATRYVHMEAGHAAQNVYLQAVALGLGTVVLGAFRDERVGKVLQLPENEQPLSIMPVGIPRR
jgi:SagB-type dehydrogenase family enzyme